MSPGTGTSLQDIKQLLEQIIKLCGKISVAKKETSQLAERCRTLSDRLSDRPHGYDDIKSLLVKIKEQLTDWSKLNYPKSFMRKAQIEAGVAGFTEELQAVISASKAAKVETASPTTETNGAPPLTLLELDGKVERRHAYAGGPRSEIFVGQWTKGGASAEVEKVALKALRMSGSLEEAHKVRPLRTISALLTHATFPDGQKLEPQLLRWLDLRHDNLLLFYGIVKNIDSHLYIVSPWCENGNLLDYVKKTPEANKNHLLRGSADGLSYLHSRGIIHGSVKCKNVLVSDEGKPQICDFELAKITSEINGGAIVATVSSGHIVRYAAPELIETNDAPATTHSDTYSFALLVLECITEEKPFSHISRDAAVLHARIQKRQLPPRPDGQDEKKRISDDLWKLMTECWDPSPEGRPSMGTVQNFLISHRG